MLLSSDYPLPDIIQDQIEGLVTQQQFPWYLVKETTFADGGWRPYEGKFDNSSFSHVVVMDYEPVSQYYDLFESALRIIADAAGQDFSDVYRVRLGCLLPDKLEHHCPHVDFQEEHVTALYYVNDSDGPTKLYNADKTRIVKEIHPKKGRVLFFDGLTYHASSNPSKKYRLVINMNFEQ